MRTSKPSPALLVLLASLPLMLAGLAGCTGDADPAGTPAPSPSPARTSAPTPTPTPTSTPTGLVRAPDDPDWTEDQLAAARLLDDYEEWEEVTGTDPGNADQAPMAQLLWDPFLTTTTTNLVKTASKGNLYIGGFTPVIRVVGPEQVMDGHREIVVRQCEENDPGSYVVENGATTPCGESRTEYRYVVQWVEEVQGWRIVDSSEMGSC
jgi:hypothetical protein